MCDPVSMGLATFGVGAAQSIAGYQQASANAKRQNQYYADNARASDQALVNSYAADQTQMIQERNKASQEAFENNEKAVAAQGTAVTAAGQAGVGGLSVDELVGDYSARASRARSDIDQNYTMQSQYLQNVEASQQDQTISRINSVQRVAPPSLLSAGLGIVGSAVQGIGQTYHDSTLTKYWQQNGGQSGTMNMAGIY